MHSFTNWVVALISIMGNDNLGFLQEKEKKEKHIERHVFVLFPSVMMKFL